MFAAVSKWDLRADDQVSHRARDDDFAWACKSTDACRDVNGEAAEIVPAYFAFTGMDADVYLDAEFSRRIDKGLSAPNRACRTVKSGDKSVARCLISRPRLRESWSRTERSCASRRERHRRSPSDAVRAVDETMSLNITVVRTRSISVAGRTPVRNSAISSVMLKSSGLMPVTGLESVTNFDPRMCLAR